MEKNLTVGNPVKIIARFMIPVMLGNLFQQLYTMADTAIVGRFVGTTALAAVGSTGTIVFLILGFMMGLTSGFTILTGQCYGAGDYDGMRRTVASAGVLSLAAALIMTAASMAGMRALLTLMNTPDDIFHDAYVYVMILCGGTVTLVLYNLFSSILRALGNSRVPLYFLVFSAFLNVALDLAFILIAHWGSAGAAAATVLSQGISAFLCLIYIVRKVPILHLKKRDFTMDPAMVRHQLGIGVPMALQFSITALGSMMVQTALNTFGSLYVAAFTAAQKIDNLIQQIFVALGTTMAAYSAQNVGAGEIGRIRKGFRASTLISAVYSVVIGVAVYLWGYRLTALFVSENLQEVEQLANVYLQCIAAFLIPLAIVNIYRNGIQGMGYGFLPMTAGVAELVGRGVTAVVASGRESYWGICMASPMAWILAGTLLIVMYLTIMRRLDGEKGK